MKFLFVACLLAISLSASESKLCSKFKIGSEEFYLEIRSTGSENYLVTVLDSHGNYESSGELRLQSRARCMDCNEDVFDIIDAPGQTVKFEGKRSDAMNPFSETGIVYLGVLPVSYTKTNCPKSVLSSGDV